MENRNIVIESNIPFIKGLLEPYFNVKYLNPQDITSHEVKDTDALLVRTRTRCDANLLDDSNCKFIGTCTIGTDHIDLSYCKEKGITVANAPGCNAPAVAQYVFSSILQFSNRPLSQYCIGIVGVGHVGKIVEKWARQMGMDVLLNDPPRQMAEGGNGWSSIDEIAEKADIITFHTPLDDSTRHLVDAQFLNKLYRSPIIINAARGPIVDTPALVDAIDEGKIQHAFIDCWEGEPDINLALLSRSSIATPHIAGYSYEGKVRATRMILDALCKHFDLPHIDMAQQVAAGAAESVNPVAIVSSYNPLTDTCALKKSPSDFETLRNQYNLRHEVLAGEIDIV